MNFDFLSETELFGGCQPEDIRQMAASLNLHTARYPKGSVIFEAGTAITAAFKSAITITGETKAFLPSQRKAKFSQKPMPAYQVNG